MSSKQICTTLVVAGTRPECIKLAPMVRLLDEHHCFKRILVNSGQHAALVEQGFAQFGITSDRRLRPVLTAASVTGTVTSLARSLFELFSETPADLVIVQGDTATSLAGALAAVRARIPLAHIEAGLRTDHPYRPFPEECMRRQIARLADLHFAPTQLAAENLLREGVAREAVHEVGNTGIDSLRWVLSDKQAMQHLPYVTQRPYRDLLALTMHRRENWGTNIAEICYGVLDLLRADEGLYLFCPVHPNPSVAETMRRILLGSTQITLMPPQAYRDFITLAAHCRLIITDSGGLQEEAPYLGVPMLVPRENTERTESLVDGYVRLIPARRESVVQSAHELLQAPRPRTQGFTAEAPYGDGRSSERILRVLEDWQRIQHAKTSATLYV